MPGARRRPVRGDQRRATRRSSPTASRRSPRRASSSRPGTELEADLIVTATGLNLLPLGGMEIAVDGREIDAVGDRRLQGHDVQRRAEPRDRARLHERVVDAEVRPDLRVRLPAAQPHGRARLPAVHAARARSVAPDAAVASTSPPATCCARSTRSPSRGSGRRGGCTRTTRATSCMLRRGALEDEGMEFSNAGVAVEPAEQLAV